MNGGRMNEHEKVKLDIAWSKVALLEGQVTAIQIALRTLLRHSQNRAAATGLINEELEKVIASALSDDSDDPDLRRDAQSRSPKTSAWHSFRNFAGMGVAHLELAFLSAASEVLAFIARHSSISARRNSGSSCDKWPCSATSRQSVSVIAWFWYWVS